MPSLYERLRAEMEEAASLSEKSVVEDYLRDLPFEYLLHFQEVIEETIQERYNEEKGSYTFGLFVNDQLSDEITIDENDPTTAMQIFLHQQGWADKLIEPFSEQAHVELTSCVYPLTDKAIFFKISPEEFEETFGRKPVSQEEFNSFHILVEKALKQTDYINWDIIFSVVKDEMKGGE